MSALQGSASVSFPHRTNPRRTALLLAGVLVLCVSATAAPVQPPPPPSSCPGGGDLASRVNAASKVFDGKARTRSAIRDGVYNVTFTVKHVYKDLAKNADLGNQQVRLQFADKSGLGRQQCAGANVKPGRKYIVFVDSVGPHVFRPKGEPVLRNKENVKAVKEAVCRASLRLTVAKNRTFRPKETLTINCRAKGAHVPRVLWYKDGVKLELSSSTRIRVKKKRIFINNVRPEDTGVYECRAVINKCGTVKQSTRITVQPENTTTHWPMSGKKCPIDSYCLNGGTCLFYDSIGEMACQCAEGFKGQRCDLKDVFNKQGSTYRHMSYFCKLGISDRYYC